MAGIYLHIPFCKQACNYCNFHFSTSLKQKEALLAALHKEIELQRNWLNGANVDTIYIGGGTPSLLSVDELRRLIDCLVDNFKLGQLREFTLEANPDDLSWKYMKQLKTTLVNRLSVGIQSFREEDLRYMNRAHTAQQSDYALKAAQDNGFSNLSIDLIYGTPGMADAAWLENINKMASLAIPHFSAYALTVEEGTALHFAINRKAATPVDEVQSAGQAQLLMQESVRLGYEQYEISNYSLPGSYAVHNTSYWQGAAYLGLGPSAHSYNGAALRQWNIANNALYIRSINNGMVPFEMEQLSNTQQLNEYLMTSLRTTWGCDLNWIEQRWGAEIRQQIFQLSQPHREVQKLQLQEGKLVLTPSGKLFADGIAASLFSA